MANKLNSKLVLAAKAGDQEAMKKIVDMYMPYINTLAGRTVHDDDGNSYIGINVDLQDRLITKVIEIITNFNVA